MTIIEDKKKFGRSRFLFKITKMMIFFSVLYKDKDFTLILYKKIMKLFSILSLLVMILLVPAYLHMADAARPAYVYDHGDVISSYYESLLDSYLRQVDDATSTEIIVWTTPSFYGHGIKKDGVEIHERDMLANYIFNEVSLDGIKGIGKTGKDNGILVLLSREKDSLGGSMRIEVGRGLEGEITDGTAGEILDAYLVPARNSFLQTQDTGVFDNAFMNTVSVLAQKAGYEDGNSAPTYYVTDSESDFEELIPFIPFIIIFVIFFILARKKKGRRGFSGGYIGGGFGGGGGGSGGGFGGGGGGSGGGGAGR